MCLRAASAALAFAFVLLSGITPQSAQAQLFTVIYSFGPQPDGENPWAGLVQDASGNFYGTTTGGGAYGVGAVFKLDTAGNETVLHSFTGVKGDGGYPYAPPILDVAGNLYGTTLAGGNTGCLDGAGCGTVFTLDKHGRETVLYTFSGGKDGARPSAPVIRDSKGTLYGTTSAGGTHDFGTVFKLSAAGKETVLHSFTSGSDGAAPNGGLVRDKRGTFYGTTSGNTKPNTLCDYGRTGTVFKLDSAGDLTVLHSFTGGVDGGGVCAGVIRDRSGSLYGTTSFGGDKTCSCGIVFKLDKTGKLTVLHTFTGQDGAGPYAGLVQDAAGTLYGTTTSGGDLSCMGGSGCGTVFRVTKTAKEAVLHAFTGEDGTTPYGGLVRGKTGILYGTATFNGAYGYGVVFKLSPK